MFDINYLKLKISFVYNWFLHKMRDNGLLAPENTLSSKTESVILHKLKLMISDWLDSELKSKAWDEM